MTIDVDEENGLDDPDVAIVSCSFTRRYTSRRVGQVSSPVPARGQGGRDQSKSHGTSSNLKLAYTHIMTPSDKNPSAKGKAREAVFTVPEVCPRHGCQDNVPKVLTRTLEALFVHSQHLCDTEESDWEEADRKNTLICQRIQFESEKPINNWPIALDLLHLRSAVLDLLDEAREAVDNPKACKMWVYADKTWDIRTCARSTVQNEQIVKLLRLG